MKFLEKIGLFFMNADVPEYEVGDSVTVKYLGFRKHAKVKRVIRLPFSGILYDVRFQFACSIYNRKLFGKYLSNYKEGDDHIYDIEQSVIK